MVLAIFVGGIFLGFCLGFATLAAVVARRPHGQSEEAAEVGDYPSSAHSSLNRFRPALRSPEVFLTPWL
jgi:hypothetical protein